MKIPFKFMPASWGLAGSAYEEAEANYNLKGEDLDRRLLEIRHKDEPEVLKRKLIEVEHRYFKIDSYQRDTRLNELDHADENDRLLAQIDIDVLYGKLAQFDGAVKKVEFQHANAKTDEEKIERDLAMLEVDHEFGRLEKNAYEKRKATLKNEPWVGFVDNGFNPNEGLDGFRLELDYNPQWIDYLRLHGFVGHTDEQVLEDWFVEVCRSNAQMIDPESRVIDAAIAGKYPMGFTEKDYP